MPKISWREYPELFWLNQIVKMRNLLEFYRVIRRYYSNKTFRQIDIGLLRKYVLKNPYTISKEFLLERGEEEIYAYGETPLTTLELISKESGLSSTDTVFELGCGRGRGCFWLRCFIGCRVVGIEYIPEFVRIAKDVQQRYELQGVEFRLGDILEADYSGATVIYLYGTCYEQPFIKKLLRKLDKLPKGTKLITVSYPLTDYTESTTFEVIKKFSATFTWGEADVYLHVKRK